MGVNNPGQTDDGDDNRGTPPEKPGTQKPGQVPGEGDRQSPGENKPGQGFPDPGQPNRNPNRNTDPNRR